MSVSHQILIGIINRDELELRMFKLKIETVLKYPPISLEHERSQTNFRFKVARERSQTTAAVVDNNRAKRLLWDHHL